MNRVAALVREPLVQFLVLGAVIAVVYAMFQSGPNSVQEEVIVIGEGRIDQLSSLFERTWNRPPNAEELENLVDGFVREEILFRAGTALGLVENDVVVRGRIVQKMQFLLEPDPLELQPSDEELAAHLEANRDFFRTEPLVALTQVFFDESRHGDGMDAAVAEARAALDGGASPTTLGDNTLLPKTMPLARASDVARQFGSAFANAIADLPVGEWSGPVRSPFGVHLVKKSESVPARFPGLSDVRDRVLQSFRADRREKLAEERFDAIAARYRVIRDTPDGEEKPI